VANGIMQNDFDQELSRLPTSRFLLEPSGIVRKRKPPVDRADETGVPDSINGSHEVADVLGPINDIGRPQDGRPRLGACQRCDEAAKVGGEEKAPVEQQQIRFDVEETECDGPWLRDLNASGII